ncbi:MAG: DUF4397 domain-containing protein [Lachnospiraceae bacterium]|nr:DUF4397 domain-containing protein [Lachnospiraceae bacterium]
MIRYYGMDQEGQTPAIPLPNPGEGGPVYDGAEERPEFNEPAMPPAEKPQIPQLPLIPQIPQMPQMPQQPSRPMLQVRFVNAANGYEPFTVYWNNRKFVNGLAFKETSGYEPVMKGDGMITLAGPDGYIYYQRPYRLEGCRDLTIVIANTGSNLELVELPEYNCK